MLVFVERGKLEYPEKKTLEASERTNNKLNPHMVVRAPFELALLNWMLLDKH